MLYHTLHLRYHSFSFVPPWWPRPFRLLNAHWCLARSQIIPPNPQDIICIHELSLACSVLECNVVNALQKPKSGNRPLLTPKIGFFFWSFDWKDSNSGLLYDMSTTSRFRLPRAVIFSWLAGIKAEPFALLTRNVPSVAGMVANLSSQWSLKAQSKTIASTYLSSKQILSWLDIRTWPWVLGISHPAKFSFFPLILPQSKPLMTMNTVQRSERARITSPLDVAVASIDRARSAHKLVTLWKGRALWTFLMAVILLLFLWA